jgi:hypothetical protein
MACHLDGSRIVVGLPRSKECSNSNFCACAKVGSARTPTSAPAQKSVPPLRGPLRATRQSRRLHHDSHSCAFQVFDSAAWVTRRVGTPAASGTQKSRGPPGSALSERLARKGGEPDVGPDVELAHLVEQCRASYAETSRGLFDAVGSSEPGADMLALSLIADLRERRKRGGTPIPPLRRKTALRRRSAALARAPPLARRRRETALRR